MLAVEHRYPSKVTNKTIEAPLPEMARVEPSVKDPKTKEMVVTEDLVVVVNDN